MTDFIKINILENGEKAIWCRTRESMENVDAGRAAEITGNMARDLYVRAFQKVYPNLAPRQIELKNVFTKCYANASAFAKAA